MKRCIYFRITSNVTFAVKVQDRCGIKFSEYSESGLLKFAIPIESRNFTVTLFEIENGSLIFKEKRYYNHTCMGNCLCIDFFVKKSIQTFTLTDSVYGISIPSAMLNFAETSLR